MNTQSKVIRKKHLDLIRKIAWSFHSTTGLDWEDLFSEGCLAYCLSIEKFDKTKGAKISTFLYMRINNHLINYINKNKRQPVTVNTENYEHPSISENTINLEIYGPMTKEMQIIIASILLIPEKYIDKHTMEIKWKALANLCVEHGFDRKVIWQLTHQLDMDYLLSKIKFV